MKTSELRTGDILRVDYSDFGRPVVYYVVMNGIAVSFRGDVNCGNRPSGWLDLKTIDICEYCDAVYRAKHCGDIFNGDFDNERIYDCIWRA